MVKVIAFANQKGGVGKTTSCVNLGASLAATQKRVLLIDLDPQGNATMGSGVDKNTLAYSICNVLVDAVPLRQVILKPEKAGYHLAPSNRDLTAAEVQLLEKTEREQRLKIAITAVEMEYDYILIDCPPSLNMLVVNALVAANSVIIPMQCEYYALEGLSALMTTIKQVQITHNPRIKIEGVLRTMYDVRNRLAIDVSQQLTRYFGDKVYRTIVPRNVRLAEAPSHGLPAIIYDKYSKGAVAYLALAGEILRREDTKKVDARACEVTT